MEKENLLLKQSDKKAFSCLFTNEITKILISNGFVFKSPYIINGRVKVLSEEFQKNPQLLIIEYVSEEDLRILEEIGLIEKKVKKIKKSKRSSEELL